MPRASHIELLGRRDLLVVCWNFLPEFFGLLAPKAQWEDHRFYAPSKSLTDGEVIEHINEVLSVDPSLAQRVGKHYKCIFTPFKHYADQVGKTNWEEIRRLLIKDYVKDNADPTEPTKPGKKPVVLMPIVKPDIDVAKTARAFVALADRIREGKGRPTDKAA
jgi:hypothetical protein